MVILKNYVYSEHILNDVKKVLLNKIKVFNKGKQSFKKFRGHNI
jgi:hypothetical protein